MDVFILCGQSNMAGRGQLPTSSSNQSSSSSLSNRTVINGHEILNFSADNEWIAASDPLHYDKPEKVGVGPGLSFAKLVAELDILDNNRKIGLIPCAVGGTSIKQWLPKHIRIEKDTFIEMDPETKQNEDEEPEDGLFEIAISRTKLALHTPFQSSKRNGLHTPHRNGTELEIDQDSNVLSEDMTGDEHIEMEDTFKLDIELKAILWHQGESDCDSQQNANLYTEAATILFEHFRCALGESNIPIIVGGLGDFLGQNTKKKKELMFYNVINTALKSLPQRVHNVGYVSSVGLTHKGDFLHFNTESARILGHRYGEKYAQLSGMVTKEELNKYIRFTKFRKSLSTAGKKAIARTRGISWTYWLAGTVLVVGSVCAYKLYMDRNKPNNSNQSNTGNIHRGSSEQG